MEGNGLDRSSGAVRGTQRGDRRSRGESHRSPNGRRWVEDFQPRARQLTPSAVGRSPCPKKACSPQIKRLVVGKPIPSHLAHHERLSRVTGLAVLSSDALSSVAYATEEIAARAGARRRGGAQHREPDRVRHRGAFSRSSSSRTGRRSTPIRAAAAPTSSRRTTSARRRRSSRPASLLIDYILTVAVSIAAGVAAITSAFPQWHVNRVELTLAFVRRPDDRQPARHSRIRATSSPSRPTSSSSRRWR